MNEPDNKEQYWATRSGDALVKILRKKRTDFLDLMDSSGLMDRVEVNISYFHGISDNSVNDLRHGIQVSGTEGDMIEVFLDAFHSSVALLKTYITSGRIEWDALATDESTASLNSAKKANQVLDALILDTSNGLESKFKQSVEDALITTAGWLWILRDYSKGRETGADVDANRLYHEGVLKFLNPAFTDVVFDYNVRDYKDSAWLLCRYQCNRWDLIAQHPEKKQEILDADREPSDYDRFDYRLSDQKRDSDIVWKYVYYHKKTPALPTGKYACFVGNTVLEEHPYLPGGVVPVHRIVPGQFLFTPFGFTPAFGAQAPQELLNSVVSSIATNQNALGTNKVWKKPGEPIRRAQLEPGVTVIESETKPEVIDLLRSAPELYKSIEVYVQFLERALGVNATAHGQPATQLESGAALAFTEQRVQQAASDLVDAYEILLSDVGTSIIKILADLAPSRAPSLAEAALAPPETDEFTGEPMEAPEPPEDPDPYRVGSGRNAVSFYSDDLDGIDHVAIVKGNPLLKTLGGRIHVGDVLRQQGDVDAEDYLTFIQTGSLDKLMQSRDGQLDLIHAENDALMRGDRTHLALPTDNQILHIKLHAASISKPEVRRDPLILQAHMAAILQHKQLFLDPMTQTFQTLLYGAPAAAPAQPMGTPPAPEEPSGQPQLKGAGDMAESGVTEAAGTQGRAPTI